MASMSWNKLLCANRLNMDSTCIGEESGRSHFHKDIDRITFSSSFRRLGRKTQVHPLILNDHIHTRLTHSLEVACVGRTLGELVGEKIDLPSNITTANIGQIVQAACLAHDIGNPPFGHAGEEAIRSWFKQMSNENLFIDLEDDQKEDLLLFEGNAQGFRIVANLEYNKGSGGMRLTYATLGTLLKYPWTSLKAKAKKKKKYSFFVSELDLMRRIADQLGLIQIDELEWSRHPLSYLVEAADDICYSILDLEDAHEMRILRYEDIGPILEPLCKDDKDFDDIIHSTLSNRRKISFLRGKAIGTLVTKLAGTFINHMDSILKGTLQNGLIDNADNDVQSTLTMAKDLAKERIFKHPRKIELEIGSYSSLGTLLEAFCTACHESVYGKKLSYKNSRIIDLLGYNTPSKGCSLYEAYLTVIDYISGMTDSYATYIASQLEGQASHSRDHQRFG